MCKVSDEMLSNWVRKTRLADLYGVTGPLLRTPTRGSTLVSCNPFEFRRHLKGCAPRLLTSTWKMERNAERSTTMKRTQLSRKLQLSLQILPPHIARSE